MLGGILLEPERLSEIELQTQDFSGQDHQIIFDAMLDLEGQGKGIDLVTLSEHLDRIGKLVNAGGAAYLATIARDTPGASNIAAYAGIIEQHSTARKASIIGQQLIEHSQESSAVDAAIRELMALQVRSQEQSMSVQDSIPELIDLIDRRFRGLVEPGLSWGLKRLDEATGGLTPGNLYIVAARPAMGKTGFASGVVLANPGVSIGFMSMEQPRIQIVQRMAASIANLSAHCLRIGKLKDEDWPQLDVAFQTMKKIPCYINERPAPPMDAIARQARKWAYEKKIKLLIVDYLQRIRSVGKEPRHEQVEGFARGFKEIARELNIPVLVLCQVNRNVENRNDKRPQMADLRDSGAIEQEADVITTLYREEVYNDDPKYKDQAEVAVIKNRHGSLGKQTCHFNGPSIRFEDTDRELDCVQG